MIIFCLLSKKMGLKLRLRRDHEILHFPPLIDTHYVLLETHAQSSLQHRLKVNVTSLSLSNE